MCMCIVQVPISHNAVAIHFNQIALLHNKNYKTPLKTLASGFAYNAHTNTGHTMFLKHATYGKKEEKNKLTIIMDWIKYTIC